jgi:hypothetical protein
MSFEGLDPITRNHVKSDVHHIVRKASVDRFVNFVHQDPFPHLWPFDEGDKTAITDTIYLFFYQRKTGIGKNELASRVKGWYRGRANSLKHNFKVISKEMFGLVSSVIEPGSIHEWRENTRNINYQGKKLEIHLKADSADFRLPGAFDLLAHLVQNITSPFI